METKLRNKRVKNIARTILSLIPIFSLVAIFFLLPTEVAHAGNPIAWLLDLGFSAIGEFLTWIFGNIFRLLAWVMSLIAGLIGTLGSQFLDMAVRYAIDGSNLTISGVVTGWTIFRDLVNMLFIFILLYAAIMTILQASSFNTKRILANLLIVGLLINFSFFLTAFVIDIGNALANIIYDSITPNGVSVGGLLTDRMNLSLLKDTLTDSSPFKIGMAHLLNAMLFLIAAFVFFSGAFLFITRHIALLFVLILSPVAFAALILPNTKQHFNKWLSALIGNTFVAPIYLLFIAITLAIANASELLTAAANPSQQIGTSGQISLPFVDTPGILMNYIIVAGFMIGSLIISKSVAASTAGAAMSVGGKVMGYGLGKGAVGANRLVGGRFAKMRNNTRLQDTATGKRGNKFTQFAARQAMTVADKGAKVNFNAARPLSGALGLAGVKVDLDKNHGKGGYDEWKKQDIKKEQERSKLYDNTTEVRDAKEAKYKADEEMRAETMVLEANAVQHEEAEKDTDMKETRDAQAKLAEINVLEKEVDALKKAEDKFEKANDALKKDRDDAQYDGRHADVNNINQKIKGLNDAETSRLKKDGSVDDKEKELVALQGVGGADQKAAEDLVNSNQHLITAQTNLARTIEGSKDKILGEKNEKGEREGGLTADKKKAVDNMLAGKQRAREDYAQTRLEAGFGTDLEHILMRSKKEKRDIWDDIRFDAGKSQKQRTAETIEKLMADNEGGGSAPPPITPTPLGGTTP